MALGNRQSAQIIRLGIKEHSLCQERPYNPDHDRPDNREARQLTAAGFDIVTRKNNNTGVTTKKWVKYHDYVEGFLTKMEWFAREHNGVKYRGYKLFFEDNGEQYTLDILLGAMWDIWVKTVENIDLSQKIRISCWENKQEQRTAFCIRQNGIALKRRYTKENPGDCPPAVENPLGGWDWKEQQVWLWKRMRDVVIPNIEKAAASRQPAPVVPDAPDTEVDYSDSDFNPEDQTMTAKQQGDSVQAPPAAKAAAASSAPATRDADDDIIPF